MSSSRAKGFTFRHHACYSPEYSFYIFSQQIYLIIFLDFLLPSSFIPLQNVVYFLMLRLLVHKILTFYINGVLNCKCPAPGPKGWCAQPVPFATLSKACYWGISFAGIPGLNSAGGMDVCCECCVSWGRGFYGELIARTEVSYRVSSVWVWSWNRDNA